MTEELDDYEWKRRHAVLYGVELSSLYHRKRERFYDMMDRGAKAVAVMGGSAAFAKPLGEWLQAVAVLIAVSSALSLVWSFSERARKHGELARQFCELGADIVRDGEHSFTHEQVAEWDARMRMLEATEPAALRALVLICQNQLAIARGAEVHSLWFFKRWTAQLLDWDVTIAPRSHRK